MTDVYGTLQGCIAYNMARGRTAWGVSGSDAELEAALLRGSEAIDRKYASRFLGVRTEGRDQDREWPRSMPNGGEIEDRYGFRIAVDAIPTEVIHAAYEAAEIERVNPGSINPVITPNRQVQSERVEGAVSRTFFNRTDTKAAIPVITFIDELLDSLLRVRTMNITHVNRA